MNPKKSLSVLAGAAILAGVPLCGTAQLVDQWNFNETSGTTAANSVGSGPSAALMGNATFNGSGGVTLNGSSGTYVNLGTGLLSGMSSATFEGWFTYSVPNNNVHLFSFDDGSGTGSGGTYLRYNVYDSGNNHGGTNFIESIQGWGGPILHGGQVLPQNQEIFVAAVYDPANNTESLYLNGQLSSTYSGALAPLSAFASSIGSLGRSPWFAYGDPYLNGTIDQFSIYNGALSSSQISADFAAGPVTVPEPSSVALGIGGVALMGVLRRRNSR